MKNDIKLKVFLCVALFALLIPLNHLLLPATSSLHIPIHIVTLLGKYLCFMLLALAIDLVWGYCGILSLGHTAFFALGGYVMGMYLMRQIGARGVYGNPILPDFMVFLNYNELPFFWTGFQHFHYTLVMIILVPAFLALVISFMAFRSRVSGVYLSIITQALTYALMLAFFRNDLGMGGNNGLTDFKDILGFPLQATTTRLALFIASVSAVIAFTLLSYFMMKTRFGVVITAIRDNEPRMRFLGYNVDHYKVLIFVYSALIAGVAGALYVPQVGIINPSEFSPLASLEAVVWVALGGRGTLFGALFGAGFVNFLKTTVTSGFFAPYWLFILGGLFVLITLKFPKGLIK
jgi:urea transport system permease protein